MTPATRAWRQPFLPEFRMVDDPSTACSRRASAGSRAGRRCWTFARTTTSSWSSSTSRASRKSEHGRVHAAERREPSLGELADRLGIERDQAEALARADAGVRSVSEPLGGDEGEIGVLGDLLEDPLSAADYEDVLDAIAGEQLRALLGHLSDRERDIVSARFGLDDRPAERLADIGERLGVSSERVRRLEERALAKLRHSG